MNPDKLVKMANQIGAFFEAMPDREQAVKDIAAHIQRNWDPRMRIALRDYLATHDKTVLSPMVHEAFLLVKISS
jgi:formate dehydrogenase subunit delta